MKKVIGNILIYSDKITNISNCFRFTNENKDKDVYIPFTYENGVNTKTYKSFISAGYGTDPNNRRDGVCLFDLATYQP